MWTLVVTAALATPTPPLPLPEELACEQGIGQACTVLGHAYLVGEGVPVDRFRAVQLFRKGCELDDAAACMWLAEAYRTGEGMRLDAKEAVALYERACGLGNGVACRSVGDLHTMESVAGTDGRTGGAWYVKGCELGDPQSCTAAALWIERGDGGTPDLAKSLAFFEKACQGGHRRGCTMLGDRYQRGSDGAPKDPIVAYEWYRTGCTTPFDPEACRVYGEAQIKGRSVPKDVEAGLSNLDRACYMNDVEGCRALAIALESMDRLAEALMAGQRGCDLGDRTACMVAGRVTARLGRELTP